jgi:glucosamine-phosphate N-acetyltransferase
VTSGSIDVRRVTSYDVRFGLLDSLEALAPVNLTTNEAVEVLWARDQAGIETFGAFDHSGKLLGTATLFMERKFIHGGGLVGHVEDVAVRKSKQGEGIGRALVEHIILRCREAGCYKVILNTDSATSFYQSLGFRTHDTGMRLDLK